MLLASKNNNDINLPFSEACIVHKRKVQYQSLAVTLDYTKGKQS